MLLGKYPVTVAEFQCFIQSGGYQDRDAWGNWWEVKEKNGWTEPRGWDEQIDHLNRPVTGVSWYEAAAYSIWLAGKTGMNFRLPNESEWEKAATHPKGGYPWGPDEPTPELMNFDENVGNPTPVGIYQGGAAPGGHLDMTGNVWEWCEDWYREYHDRKISGPKDIDGGAGRVIRGGSWVNYARDCRSAIHVLFAPVNRYGFLGFRLARSVTLGP